MGVDTIERFWDRRAREDPFHFVDNQQRFGATDADTFWRRGETDLDALLDSLAVSFAGDEDVVDIGCGVGRLTRALSRRCRSVHALDVSEVMLEHARRHNPALENVRWVHGDGTTLQPLPDAAFDACISWVVFQHLPEPELTYGYVREMGRVLRPGGWAAFQVSNDPRVHRSRGATRWLREELRAVSGRGPRGQGDPAWLGSAVTIEGLRRAGRQGGLELERLENEGTQFCLVLARRHDR